MAIVDAFDDPNAEADLALYRSQYGLPACTSAGGCFQKVNETGGTSYPAPDADWSGEISLDLDMVSAIAPEAHIILVEASTTAFTDLGAGVDEAVSLGAGYVSNSYGTGYTSTPGSGEDPSETTALDPYYNHPGVAVVASSGDGAYGVAYPAASQFVTSVGGTSLVKDSSTRGWSESVWFNSFGGPGSGCSLYEPKPSFQQDTGCAQRTVADVSAVADPTTGVAVYDTYQAGGWQVFGGTSVASPIIASVYADAGAPVGRHVSELLSVREPRRAQRRDAGFERHLFARLHAAPRGPATTVPPGSARRTASPPSPADRTARSRARSRTAPPRSPARRSPWVPPKP